MSFFIKRSVFLPAAHRWLLLRWDDEWGDVVSEHLGRFGFPLLSVLPSGLSLHQLRELDVDRLEKQTRNMSATTVKLLSDATRFKINSF